MGGDIKYPREAALAVARELCAALKPVTTKLMVAGSLRRRKAAVGDVEIIYLGRSGFQPDPNDLLGHQIQTNLADQVINEWVAAGMLSKRPNKNGGFSWGGQNKLAVHAASGIPVDFFQTSPSGWWSLVVCRTGSAANNERICNAAIARGLRWNPYHGFEDRRSGALLHVARSEQDVFARVGLAYVEPWLR
jgi:DNA polymerase/3'-5' exonuclease PolX